MTIEFQKYDVVGALVVGQEVRLVNGTPVLGIRAEVRQKARDSYRPEATMEPVPEAARVKIECSVFFDLNKKFKDDDVPLCVRDAIALGSPTGSIEDFDPQLAGENFVDLVTPQHLVYFKLGGIGEKNGKRRDYWNVYRPAPGAAQRSEQDTEALRVFFDMVRDTTREAAEKARNGKATADIPF